MQHFHFLFHVLCILFLHYKASETVGLESKTTTQVQTKPPAKPWWSLTRPCLHTSSTKDKHTPSLLTRPDLQRSTSHPHINEKAPFLSHKAAVWVIIWEGARPLVPRSLQFSIILSSPSPAQKPFDDLMHNYMNFNKSSVYYSCGPTVIVNFQ